MKKFLVFGLSLFVSTAVLAQAPVEGADVAQQDGALPFNIPVAVTPKTTPAPVPNAQSVGVNPTANIQGGGLFPELGMADASSQKKAASEAIYLVINDVTIVQPAFGGIAFCTGTMTAKNEMNVTLRGLRLSLKYGSLDVPMGFSGVAPYGGEQTQPIAWAGENCKNMLDIPQMTVLECSAPGISKTECEGKIKYMPIRNEQ